VILQEPLNEQEVQALHTAFHTMQAEVEQLRAALEAIVQVDEISAGESWEDAFYNVAGIARAALAEEEI